MPRQKVDPEIRKAIYRARKLISDLSKADGNEAETRRRIDRIFESVLGYDTLKYLTRERAVQGTGETEYCDFAIQLEEGDKAKPIIFIELKRVNINLAKKHLKQVSSYAINEGCEWILLTNGREWKLYHVSYGKPPETKLIETWNLLHDDISVLADKFFLLSYRQIKKGILNALWEKANVLTPRNLLASILSDESIRLLRRQLRNSTGVLVPPEDVISTIRKLLNESAIKELETIKFALPRPKPRKRKTKLKAQNN